ncbi:MAG: dCTP deaminase [bacterium]
MSVLCDWQIKQRCEKHQMIWPYRPELLNPASLDVVIGSQLMMEVADTPELQRLDISDRTAEDPYLLLPGEFVLTETFETMNIPSDISAQFVLKSSRAREGYQHMLAGWAEGGFHGSKLTLEIQNARRHHPLPIYPNLKIGQMVFFEMSGGGPEQDYSVTGRYNNTTQVTPSKDDIFKMISDSDVAPNKS